MSAADLDGDKDIDLVLGTSWIRNEYPLATWTPFTIHVPTNGRLADRNELHDFNEDGLLDVVIGYAFGQPNKVAWYERRSDITQPWIEYDVLEITTANPKGFVNSIEVKDMDGDGDGDIIAGEYRVESWQTEYPAKLWLLENLGEGADWRPYLVYDGDSHYQAAVPIDIDKDGDFDIISKGWMHSEVYIYENKADNTCETP